MYIIIKKDKSEHIKEKVHKMKEMASDIMECLEEAYREHHESGYERDSVRHSERDYYGNEDYDDYSRDMARGMGRGRGRGRY